MVSLLCASGCLRALTIVTIVADDPSDGIIELVCSTNLQMISATYGSAPTVFRTGFVYVPFPEL
jgi:hypothetical protein